MALKTQKPNRPREDWNLSYDPREYYEYDSGNGYGWKLYHCNDGLCLAVWATEVRRVEGFLGGLKLMISWNSLKNLKIPINKNTDLSAPCGPDSELCRSYAYELASYMLASYDEFSCETNNPCVKIRADRVNEYDSHLFRMVQQQSPLG